MACSQTLAGIAKDCSPSMGGIVEIYAANHGDVSKVTVTSGKISAIEMKTGAKFATYSLPRSTAYMNSMYNVNREAGTRYVSTDLFFQLNRMDTTKRTEIEAMMHADLAVIAKDANGKYWYLGYDHPADGSAATGESGTALADHNGYNATIQDNSKEMPYEVDESIIAGITD